jgi:glycosyltransferase involved in cell wall biosynthesis
MNRSRLRILYVAYPLLPVSDDSAGGAEQMLWTLERQIALRGHETVTAACAGSSVAGKLFTTGSTPSEPDRFEERAAEHEARVVEYVRQEERQGRGFALVHDKSGHFWKQAPALPCPVLATLHLPRSFYREEWFQLEQPNLTFNCVSQAQRGTFEDVASMLGVVENGIAIERFTLNCEKSDYILWIGRICEEKGPHVAIDVAERAGAPLIIAGDVYPFSYHQKYFSREIVPRLERARTKINFVQKPSFDQKSDLLRDAKAVILPALVDETSSLVAMEAMACGTPVVAFRRGALPEVVADGYTGFIVDTADAMANCIGRVREIDPHACRQRAEMRYSAQRMADEYETLYSRVLLSMTGRQEMIPQRAA